MKDIAILAARGYDLGELVLIEHEHLVFSGGEHHVRIPRKIPHDTKLLILAASIRNADDLMHVVVLNNAMREMMKDLALTCKTSLYIPYLPYARQDRVTAPGTAFSLEALAPIINSMKFDRVACFDVHSPVALTLINNIHSLTPRVILRGEYDSVSTYIDGATVIAPDKGAIVRAVGVAEEFGLDVFIGRKRRDLATGEITDFSVDFEGKPVPKKVLVVDDICDGGATFTMLGRSLETAGVQDACLYVTHGIFSHGLEDLRNYYDHIITTDSFYSGEESDYVTVLRGIEARR